MQIVIDDITSVPETQVYTYHKIPEEYLDVTPYNINDAIDPFYSSIYANNDKLYVRLQNEAELLKI